MSNSKFLPDWNTLVSSVNVDQVHQTLATVKDQILENKAIALATAASGLILTSFAYYTLSQYRLDKSYEHIPGPKKNGLFGLWIGTCEDFKEIQDRKVTIGEKMIEWYNNYGPLYKIQIANQILVCVHDPDDIKQALIEQDFPKSAEAYEQFGFPLGSRFIGKGLVTEVDKERWRKKRAMLNPAFHRNNIEEYTIQFNEQGDVLMNKLRSLADGKTPVNMLYYFNRATLDVIANVAFGLNVNSIEDENNTLNNHINLVLGTVTDLMNDPFLPLRPSKKNQVATTKESIKILRDFARNAILDRIKEMESGDYVSNDMLSIIFKSARDDNMEMEILIDEFLTLFTAGQETTANALAFCILELGRNPECLKKLREEVDQVLGSRTEITNADLIKLEYTNCVFKESMRLWPPVASIGRQTKEDSKLGGHFIPKGTYLSISQFANCRNPKYFPEPEKFKPERFMDKDSISAYNYFPFSIGPRNCIGQNFAQIEGKIILAKFVQNFDFELDPTQSFEIEERVTIRLTEGCRCILRVRS